MKNLPAIEFGDKSEENIPLSIDHRLLENVC